MKCTKLIMICFGCCQHEQQRKRVIIIDFKFLLIHFQNSTLFH